VTHAPLARRLGLGDAVVIGLGSMIGAGVFSVFAPAARAAGSGLLIGLAVAALVAYCNATSSAQLAAEYPRAGGTYLYGRERLGPWWGFAAGWSFVIGKTASCAAMAMTFAAYTVPPEWQRPVAVAAVIVLAAVNYRGVTRTASLARVLVICSTAVLLLVVVAGIVAGSDGSTAASAYPVPAVAGWYGILQSAGLLFFAFAGYARVATLGEEVREPGRTIPRAILIALGITVALYSVIGLVAVRVLGTASLAASDAPLRDVVAAAGWTGALPLVTAGAVTASLGALLALIAGVGRTTLAMAREGDLPATLAAVHPRFGVPHHAEVGLAAVVCALVLLADLRDVIGFSSFGVLLYYSVANAAAFTQSGSARRFPRVLQVLGASGCLVLVATLPWTSIVAGVVVSAAGLALRAVRMRSHGTRRGTGDDSDAPTSG
jgi:APA family basic amino acid/polyamine antiporter